MKYAPLSLTSLIPSFVILRCVLPYPFVHSDKRLRSLWKRDACGDSTPKHKNNIRPLGSDYTRCYAENASPTTPFCRRKMKKPPLSRRPALQSRQALDAAPIAYVDTRHSCRAIDAMAMRQERFWRDRDTDRCSGISVRYRSGSARYSCRVPVRRAI